MSPADVSAVIDHIYTHARGNQNGRPWSIYCRMLDFLNNGPPSPDQNGTDADAAGDRDRGHIPYHHRFRLMLEEEKS
jgi:hypothetical protein